VKANLATIVGGAIVSDTPPSSPQVGQLWFESDSGATFIWYNDGDSSQWVQIAPSGFPEAPVDGVPYVRKNGAWSSALTAETRNRIVNGAMQISEENGNTEGTTSSTNFFAADQWIGNSVSSSGINAGRQAAAGAGPGSARPYAIGLIASPIEAVAAAGEYSQLYQIIEGTRIADLLLGTAQSMAMVIAFDVYLPVAGTYWASFGQATGTHCWLGSYTISAGEINTWVRKTVTIPFGAINTGTWRIDTGASATLHFAFHCGSTYTGVAGFQAGNFIAGPGQALGLSTVNSCWITNVGLYADPDRTGVAPKWVMPDYAQDLEACMRYWQSHMAVVDTPSASQVMSYPVSLRAPPAVSGGNAGFTIPSNGIHRLWCYQTGRASNQLIMNARM